MKDVYRAVVFAVFVCLSHSHSHKKTEEDLRIGGGAIILKNARTGSTWFASKLRNFDDMQVIEEGISYSQGQNYSNSQKTTYLLNILRGAIHTKIKLCADNTKCTSERMPSRASSSVPIITMEPAFSKKIKYSMILQQTHSKLVIYVRSNTVKVAIAGIHGSLVHRFCDSHNNMRASNKCIDNVPKKITTPAEDLFRHVVNMIPQTERLFERAEATKMNFHIVIYERLQVDEETELKALRAYLGLKEVEIVTSTNLIKATPDDLRDTLTHYDEFEALLTKRATRDGASGSERDAYACLSRMLAAKTPLEHYPFCLPTSQKIPKSIRPGKETHGDEDTKGVQLRPGILGHLKLRDH